MNSPANELMKILFQGDSNKKKGLYKTSKPSTSLNSVFHFVCDSEECPLIM